MNEFIVSSYTDLSTYASLHVQNPKAYLKTFFTFTALKVN